MDGGIGFRVKSQSLKKPYKSSQVGFSSQKLSLGMQCFADFNHRTITKISLRSLLCAESDETPFGGV